jgi:transposase
LIDESGLMMAPLVRRTLAPAGQTPILKQKASHRDRVSLIAALSISPVRRQLGLRFRTYPKSYVNNERAAEFLRSLLDDLRGPVMVVWDRGNMHRGAPINELLARFPRLELHQLPPYAPELNPVEHLWNHLKYGRFPNYPPPDVATLDKKLKERLRAVRNQPKRLQAFWNASTLTFNSISEHQ